MKCYKRFQFIQKKMIAFLMEIEQRLDGMSKIFLLQKANIVSLGTAHDVMSL